MRSNNNAHLIVRVLRDRRSRVAKWGVIFLITIALLADFLANDKPLYYKIGNTHRFPALREMFSHLGLTTWSLDQEAIDWKAMQYTSVIFAPVPYAHYESDLKNGNFKGPFAMQDVQSSRFRHWLGTDHLGRDVLSGLIHGTRITLLVGVLSMLIAAFFGVPIGALAGFMGDERLRVRRVPFIINLLLGFLACYFITLSFHGGTMSTLLFAGCSILLICITILVAKRFWPDAKRWIIPADTITLRSIEIIRSIPAFFLLFAILGMLESPGIISVIVLIAFLWCPSIIRFVRAEALKLRNQPYVHSAIVLGLSDMRVIWRHIIPNAIGPALITIVFGIGSAVLIESGLSFLGIGIGPETVSWGKMLNLARSNFSAWWMALLPGAAIFLTITFFHRLGDVMESQITGR